MSYLDESEYDDRTTDGAGRPIQAARPAWDAATYGRPDDTRRARSRPRPGGGGGDHPYGDGRSAKPLYSDEVTHSTDPYAPEPYAPEPYAPEPYAPESYAPEPDRPEALSGERYRADAYPSAPYSSDPYPSDPYPSEPRGGTPSSGDSHPDGGYGADSHRDDPYATEQHPVEHYPGADPTYVDDRGQVLTAAQPKSRAGRNLPAAIGVGVVLAGAVLGSLFFWRPAFLGVLALAVGVGTWELVRAIRSSGVNPPLIPLIAGGALMAGLGWWGQADALTFGLMVTVLAAMIWRLADGVGGYGRDISAASFVAVYLPFLAGFAALLASAPADGDLRVLVTLAGVVLSDTGGYIAGVVFGRHPLAPSVSPKKSWEGLAGSLIATGVGGALLLYFLFDVAVWWGAIFGIAVSVAAVLGDLGESLIKRDLGVKDMSSLLPGHGGLMDRLDSILFAAPTSYVLLVLLAPPV